MATYIRRNAWNDNGSFSNPDLLWYAKGVGKMQSRTLDDPASWWFFAALHNEYVAQSAFPGWGAIPPPPKVSIRPVPDPKVTGEYWNQCQHQSWFFLPWHRGYLIALEKQLREDIVSLGGPSTWALPYWSYLDKGQYPMPPAFAQKTLPDRSPNPLFVDARYGPDLDGNIYVPTREAIAQHPGDPNFSRGPVTIDSIYRTPFTGSGPVNPGFGGPVTGFSNDGQTSGYLEANPHNLVHVYVGGIFNNHKYGIMADPGTAALDPIFYLHHANIDRLWAFWNFVSQANFNPMNPSWLNGPTAAGDRKFIMPMPGHKSWTYTPRDVTNLQSLDYTYQELSISAEQQQPLLASRLTLLKAPTAVTEKVLGGATVNEANSTELVGASSVSLELGSSGVSTNVRLDSGVRNKITASLDSVAALTSSPAVEPDRVFLKLENVRGDLGVGVLSVYINLPEGAKPGDYPELLAGSAGLFGIRKASATDDQHGGHGLSFVFEITDIVDQLHLDQNFDVDALHVQVIPDRAIADDSKITIGRISIYRQGQ